MAIRTRAPRKVIPPSAALFIQSILVPCIVVIDCDDQRVENAGDLYPWHTNYKAPDSRTNSHCQTRQRVTRHDMTNYIT